MNRHIIFKLLAVNLVVIGFVMAVVWISIDTLAAGYFTTLMEKYHISPEPAHAMFVGAVHRYLIWACLTAMALAALLSFFLLKKILAPLTHMTRSTKEIAAGEFKSRVQVDSEDEIGQLAKAFNQMAHSLEKIEQLRRHLMIDVAHELRTPLTNMRGYLEALNDKVLEPSSETLALLQGETMRIVKLVEDVLEQAHADAAHGHLNVESMDMAAAVHDALSDHQEMIEKKKLTLQMTGDTGLPMVMADTYRIKRVVRILTDNAIRYAIENSVIQIEFSYNRQASTVAFTNKTADLTEKDLPLLFERFYRSEKSRSREHGGAGIGLSIVKELISAHNGSVEAKLPEKNTLCISFTLPS